MYIDSDISKKYLSPSARIAVALSGGTDSVFLLHTLLALSGERGFYVSAIHVNHMIRGEEADRDENFCKELCSSLGVELFSESVNVPLKAKKEGLSLEEAARAARYSVFEAVMRRENISLLATAHNADDLAENIFIRLARGSSLDGLCGIPKERELSFGRVIRPILGVKKSEIIAYCEEKGLPFVTDSTNLCDDYVRNRIRHRVIPVMNEINPSFLSVCRRTSDNLSADADFFRTETEKICKEHIHGRILSLEGLEFLHDALLSRVINAYCISLGASPEKKHIDLLCGAVKKRAQSSVSLPGKRRAVSDGNTLSVVLDDRDKAEHTEYAFPICEGENEFFFAECGLYVKAVLRKSEDADELIIDEEKYSLNPSLIYNLSTHILLNFDTIKGELFLRNRRSGDSIDFGAFKKSIKKLMNEKHIPKNIRDLLPCLCEGDEIICVPFAAKALRVTPSGDAENAKNTYSLKLEIKIDLTEELKDVGC